MDSPPGPCAIETPAAESRNCLNMSAMPFAPAATADRPRRPTSHWIKRFIFFNNMRHPAEMAEPEMNAFQTHPTVKEKVSASPQNQALSALLFLYRHVIGREVGDLREVIRARTPKRPPVVMTREEVKAVLANLCAGSNTRTPACSTTRTKTRPTVRPHA